MKNGTQGFTLIELLIVIAIIGILAAVLIPNLLGARSKATITGAQAYARNCATAATAFALDNPGTDMKSKACATDLSAGALPAYVKSAAVNATSDAITYTYTVNGADTTASLPLNLK